jgi:hypothetical protein
MSLLADEGVEREVVDRLRGVVLVRLSGLSPAAKAEAVAGVFRDHAAELVGGFCVVAPGAARIRRPPPADQDG